MDDVRVYGPCAGLYGRVARDVPGRGCVRSWGCLCKRRGVFTTYKCRECCRFFGGGMADRITIRKSESRAQVQKRRRGSKQEEMDVFSSLAAATTPERVEEMVDKVWDWCQEHRSVNGGIKLLSLLLSYRLGQPIKRVVSTRMDVQELLASVADYDDDQFDAAIEALYDDSDK